MPDIQEGLTEGFPDVNTPDGFTAALAEKAGVEVPEETLRELRESDTSVMNALSRGNEPSPRSATEPVAESEESTEEVPEEGQASEETEETPATNAAIEEYVSKHGGTPEQALVALYDEFQNAQQLIGRQGNQMGTLQQRLDALEQFLASPQAEDPTNTPIPTSEANSELEQFFEERGPQAAMQWLVENRPDLIEQGIQVWSGYDETAATRFATRYDRFLDEEIQSPQKNAQPQEDPFLAQLKVEAQFQQAVETARVASGFSDEEWESVKDHVIPVLEDAGTSVLIKQAVSQPRSSSEQVEGLKALFQLAQAKAQSASHEEATKAAREQQQREAAARKQAAQVATGSLVPPQKGQSGTEEDDREERIKRFKQSLLDAESTDVQAGLTYGNQKS